MPLTEPVSYHVKQDLTLLLSAFHATPVSVPTTDTHNEVTYLSEHLSVGFMQPGQVHCRSRNVHFKFSDRFIFRQAEHMAKETQLSKPDSLRLQMVAFRILSIRLMFNRILYQDVLKELILFSMSFRGDL